MPCQPHNQPSYYSVGSFTLDSRCFSTAHSFSFIAEIFAHPVTVVFRSQPKLGTSSKQHFNPMRFWIKTIWEFVLGSVIACLLSVQSHQRGGSLCDHIKFPRATLQSAHFIPYSFSVSIAGKRVYFRSFGILG